MIKTESSSPIFSSNPVLLSHDLDATLPNLVAMHPIGGTVAFYRHLAAELSGVANVFAIQSPVLLGEDSKGISSVESCAARYGELCQSTLRSGKFTLLGYSYSCLIAIEMARMKLDGIADVMLVAPFREVRLVDEPARKFDFSERARLLLESFVAREGLHHLDKITLGRLKQAYEQNLQGFVNYSAGKSDLAAHVIVPADDSEGERSEALSRWGEIIPLAHPPQLVRGTHATLFQPENASSIGRLIGNLLTRRQLWN